MDKKTRDKLIKELIEARLAFEADPERQRQAAEWVASLPEIPDHGSVALFIKRRDIPPPPAEEQPEQPPKEQPDQPPDA
ncbi:MAG: hypothetical protein JXM73_16005 [Anaerolineae bacterium]|nr:hypothetical protein [Anaerolineae bacterium]